MDHNSVVTRSKDRCSSTVMSRIFIYTTFTLALRSVQRPIQWSFPCW